MFSDVGGVSSRAVLRECATPQVLLSKSEDKLANLIRTASRCGMAFSRKKSVKLRSVAEEAVKLGIIAPGTTAVIATVLDVLESLLQNIQQIEQNIKALVKLETYIQQNLLLLQTIPGIGFNSALTILSEIGDFSLFHKPKQLAAYFCLDPGERQSGKFRGSKNKMSKRGSAQVRAALHMAAVNSVAVQKKRPACNPILSAYYNKKFKSQPGKVAMCV